MAKPTTTTFGQFAIQVGDGADPEVFSEPCGLTTKGFSQTASTQDTVVPDCDNPDAPAFTEKAIDAISAQVTGSGVLGKEAHDSVWQPWFSSAAPRNVKVFPTGSAGGFYLGAALLTTLESSANRGQKVNVSVTIMFDGEYTYTPGS